MDARGEAIKRIRTAIRAKTVCALAVSFLSATLPGGAYSQPAPVPQTHAFAPPAAERPATLRGNVRDSSNSPISYATVAWGAPPQSLQSTDSGSFEIAGLTPGRTHITVRRLGFVPVEFDLVLRPGVIKPIIVTMVAAPGRLAAVAVETSSPEDTDSMRAARFKATGFFDRMAIHRGYFIPPREVDNRRPAFVSDLLYGVPGVRMLGTPHSASVRYLSTTGQCRLRIYLDGQPAPDGDDFIPGSDIKAVEIYTSLAEVPGSFMPSPLKGYCGSIVVWTR